MSENTLAGLIASTAVSIVRGSSEICVTSIVEDSRQASPGCLFVARPGTSMDGRKFIDDAVSRGAVAVLSDPSATVPEGLTFLVAEDVACAAAELAERFHGCPSRQLHLVGVTGTNGKTTTAHLVHQLLTATGKRCGLIGTVQIDDGTAKRPAHLTTPSAIELSGLIHHMVEACCTACAVEVSSHSLHQKRVAGLDFEIAIFTNLSGDHLDYHGSMEAYAAAKAMLFESLRPQGWAIVNADDSAWQVMVARCCARVLRCSLDDSSADCHAQLKGDIQAFGSPATRAIFRGPWGSIDVNLPLVGRHNVMNALQAAAAAHILGMSKVELKHALGRCMAPPGRLQPVRWLESSESFSVFVDYAHTDDALDNVLRAVRPLVPDVGKLRVVFGCGGDRDRLKRPRMAQASWRWADEVIITSDNPRTEDPDSIISEVLEGVPAERKAATTCIADRRDAIREAIFRGQPGDIIVIAGKGHEDYQIIGTEKRPFDDRVVATEALAELSGRANGANQSTRTRRVAHR